MQYLKQTKLHKPEEGQNGNCMATALACIFNLKIEDVPKFEDMPDGVWWLEYQKFIDSLGYQIHICYPQRISDYTLAKGLCLATGKSPRGDFLHCVVMKNGKCIWDPHPDNTFIEDVQTIEYFVER